MKKGSRKCLYTIRGLGVERVTIPRSPRLLVGDGGRGGRGRRMIINSVDRDSNTFQQTALRLFALRNARVQSSLTTTTTHINISDYCDQLILIVANYYYQHLAIWASYLIVGVGTNIARKAQGTYLVHFREIFQTE